jgi:hypothetical protein
MAKVIDTLTAVGNALAEARATVERVRELPGLWRLGPTPADEEECARMLEAALTPPGESGGGT